MRKFNLKSFTLALCLASVIFVSCNKDDDSSSGSNSAKMNGVYIAGCDVNSEDIEVAVYWKDTTEVELTDGTYNAIATSIAVDDDDIYVAGYEENSEGIAVAKYWKNGTEVELTNGTTDSYAYSMAVDNGDVYIAGRVNRVLVYWKNGTLVELTDGTTSSLPYNYSIVVDNGDIYVTGGQTNNEACYWKNGNLVELTDGTCSAGAYSITIADGNVYVAGYEKSADGYENKQAVYWINGTEVVLTTSSDKYQWAYASGIAVEDGNVYISGFKHYLIEKLDMMDKVANMAKCWVNDTEYEIEEVAYKNSCHAYSIAIDNGDIYIAGQHQNTGACYWKNGTRTDLMEDGTFYSILVVNN